MPTKPQPNENLQNLKDIAGVFGKLPSREEFLRSFKTVTDYIKRIEAQLFNNFRTLSQSINDKIDARLAQIQDGKDYILTDADKQQIASKIEVPIVERHIETIIEKQTPIVTEIVREVALTDTADDIRNKLELLTGDERLKAEAIQGLEELTAKVSEVAARPIGRGMSPSGPMLYVNGVKKGRAQTVNFVPGPGTTLTYAYANGRNDITITATGTGSFSILPITGGTINDSNKVFTFASTPTLVVVNGTAYRHGHGVTIATTTATLDDAPGAGDVYAIG